MSWRSAKTAALEGSRAAMAWTSTSPDALAGLTSALGTMRAAPRQPKRRGSTPGLPGRARRHQRPGPFPLDDASQVQQQGVGVVAADHLHAHRKPLHQPDGNGDGRVAADVRGDGEGAVVLGPDGEVADLGVE